MEKFNNQKLAEMLQKHMKPATQITMEIRKKYSISDELAILRQRDTKPEEFKEYFDYVEESKKKIKNQ